MEEARCLERLVEQRSQRISYIRLLSWEMDPKLSENPARKNRQLASAEVQNESSGFQIHKISSESDMNLQSIGTEVIESDKSSDSDTYYSADGNQLQDCSSSESDECFDAFEDLGDKTCTDMKEFEFDELSYKNEQLNDKDMDVYCTGATKFEKLSDKQMNVNHGHCSTNSGEFKQKRALSKKQKRKKRGKSKMTWDYDNQLPYIDDDIDLNEIKEHINERDISVRKTIPSLAELCLMSSKGISWIIVGKELFL